MARRTRQELLAEFHRLSDIFELFVEFDLSRRTKSDAAWRTAAIPTREAMLADIERGGLTLSQIMAGTREAINDQNEMLVYAAEEGDPFTIEFLTF